MNKNTPPSFADLGPRSSIHRWFHFLKTLVAPLRNGLPYGARPRHSGHAMSAGNGALAKLDRV